LINIDILAETNQKFMKNRTSLNKLLFVLAILSCMVVKAELPPLTNGYSTFPLPHKFQMTPAGQNVGYIDVDGNNTPDYLIQFYSSGIGESGECQIVNYNSSYTGNQVLTEFYISQFKSPSTPSVEKIPLSTPGEPFTALLPAGEIIGPLLISPGTGGLTEILPEDNRMWYYAPYIFRVPFNPEDAPLASNFTDGNHTGYVGIHYQGDDGWYYGWLNVIIDDNEQWVLINSAGHASASDTPVPAGLNDPFAVPIPIIASILGFGLIGGGVYLKRRKKK
jgi:hypothetical protein